jgi:hypothetical protein
LAGFHLAYHHPILFAHDPYLSVVGRKREENSVRANGRGPYIRVGFPVDGKKRQAAA